MNIAILLSGGIGTRVGGELPKQYIEVDGRPVVSYAMETFLESPKVDALWIVAEKEWREYIRIHAEKLSHAEKLVGFSVPGYNRQLSIYNAMMDLISFLGKEVSEDTIVIIHDAARPRLTQDLVSRLLKPFTDSALMVDGVMPVIPMKDTVYVCEGEKVVSLLNRSRVYAGQAPEAFRFQKYYEAIENLLPDRIRSINGSTEPAIIAGLRVTTIPGDEDNYKITTPADLEKFRREERQGGNL